MCKQKQHNYLNVASELLLNAAQQKEGLYGVVLAVLIKTKTVSSLYKRRCKTWEMQIAEDFNCSRATAAKMLKNAFSLKLIESRGENIAAKSLVSGYTEKGCAMLKGKRIEYIKVDRVRITKPDLDNVSVKEVLDHIREMLVIRAIRRTTLKVNDDNYSSTNAGRKSYTGLLTNLNEIVAARLSRTQIAKIIGLSKSGAAKLIERLIKKGFIHKGAAEAPRCMGEFYEDRKLEKGQFLVKNHRKHTINVCERDACSYWLSETSKSIFSTGTLILNHCSRFVKMVKTAAKAAVVDTMRVIDPSCTAIKTKDYCRAGLVLSIYDL